MLPPGVLATLWALYNFPVDKFGGGLIALSIVTVFFSAYLRLELPKTKLHLTISDALVFLSMLFYGGSVAVLLAMLEAGYSSLRLSGKETDRNFASTRTILMNVLITGTSTFLTAAVTTSIFGPSEKILLSGDNTTLLYLLAAMATAQFAANTVLVSAYIAVRSGRRIFDVWYEQCLSALTLFCSGALMAGLSAKAVRQTDMPMFALAVGFFALVFLTYRRYTNDVKQASSDAEQSEVARAEQAEAHVTELKHYVDELTKTTEQLTESRESYRHAAFHDPLTGLPNRSHIIASLNHLIEANDGSRSGFALLLLNLNRFRTINESLGYQTGDRVIKHIGTRLVEMARPGDVVGHFGGDQFAIIVSGLASADEATEIADAIARRVSEAVLFKGRQVYTSAGIGVVFCGPAHAKAEEMLRDADIAMYSAKDNRKSWSTYDSSMRASAVTRQQLETDLRYAIVCNELEMYYQPIIDLKTMGLYGFEALVRWNHPQQGMILPGEFIPLAEDTGLVIPMTLQILKNSCAQVVEWQNSRPEHKYLTISVNLSGKHFAEPSLVEQVENILRETAIDPACLKLEITESSTMENAESAIEKLLDIRKAGVRLSIDDFGTGYSSLSYLRRFPVNTLKIDRSFVSGIESAAENDEIVRTIMALANALDLDVVAEGIENTKQLDHLRRLGCEYGQGYLFAPPLPVSAIEEMIEDTGQWLNLLEDAVIPADGSETDFSDSSFTN